MSDTPKCSHPQMCPEQDSFATRIKKEKLSLEPPPPQEAAKERSPVK